MRLGFNDKLVMLFAMQCKLVPYFMCDDLHERHGDLLSCDPVYSYVTRPWPLHTLNE